MVVLGIMLGVLWRTFDCRLKWRAFQVLLCNRSLLLVLRSALLFDCLIFIIIYLVIIYLDLELVLH